MRSAPGLSRRRVLQLAAGVAGGPALAGLAGCRAGATDALLISVRGAMPAAWLKALPAGWRSQPLPSPDAAVQAATGAQAATLLALADGWTQRLDPRRLQPFEAPALQALLQAHAEPVSRLYRPSGAPALAFPWAFGTWLLLLRNRADLMRRREEGWSLLLDPSLRGRLVLPSSPRLVIEIACRQLAHASGTASPEALGDPRLPGQLRRLVGQALALDESDGLNLLLAGDADAAVLPSHQVIPLLQSDPRLQALLPASGSPLWWQLLLRPAPAAPRASEPSLPQAWLQDGLTLPLLDRLLAGGWVPPLAPARLAPALARWPERLRPLLLPPQAVLQRCTSLAPFSADEQRRWQQLWDAALVGLVPAARPF